MEIIVKDFRKQQPLAKRLLAKFMKQKADII